MVRAAASRALTVARVPGWSGFKRAATRETPGITSLSSSTRLPMSSADWLASPVTFPPGRARLAARLVATGSPQETQTIGMSVVAVLDVVAS